MASKSRRNQVKFKFTKELALLLVALVAMITATIVMSIPSQAERALERYNTAINDYNTANQAQYGLLDDSNVFAEKSFEDMGKMSKSTGKDDYLYVFYGSLTNATFLENLSIINAEAKEHKVEKVILTMATYVEESKDEDFKFNDNIEKMKAMVASPVQSSEDNNLEKEFDPVKYPTLLVFNNGALVFNSQTYEGNTEFTWTHMLNQAFTIKESK